MPVTMNFESRGSGIWAVNHGPCIDDEEFDAFIAAAAECAAGGETVSILVDGRGAPPGAVQRARLYEAVPPESLRIAVLLDSSVSRAAVRVFQWGGVMSIRAFAPDDLGAALADLGWTDVTGARARAQLDRLWSSLEAPVGRAARTG